MVGYRHHFFGIGVYEQIGCCRKHVRRHTCPALAGSAPTETRGTLRSGYRQSSPLRVLTMAMFAALRRSLVASTLALLTWHAQSAVLVLEDGKLVGATHVSVFGYLYDVHFVDASCAATYGDCVDPSIDFPFFVPPPDFFQAGSYDAARVAALEASTALLGQVLVDGADGSFDTTASRVKGCEYEAVCQVLTPFWVSGYMGAYLNVAAASNWSVERPNYGETDSANAYLIGRSEDLAANPSQVFAYWTLSSPELSVPSPGTLELVLLAFAVALGVNMRPK
jgi:hypothetical protein